MSTLVPISISFRSLGSQVVLLALAAALSGCGAKEDKKITSQVAAKVGGEEISIHQINQLLAQRNTNGLAPQELQAMSRQALENLIDQQLAVEQATDGKLHRSPEVVAQIEAARKEILARAYFQQILTNQSKPTPEEVQAYFQAHPPLFTQRRIFNLQEIALPANKALVDPLRSFAAKGVPIEEVAAWLTQEHYVFRGGNASRSAEQIALEQLPIVHALKDGQATVFETPQEISYLRLASSESAPVSQSVALPKIAQFLTNQRAGEALLANMKQLRAQAKIEYVGDFAKPASTATATAEQPAAQSTAKGAATAAADTAAAMDKGLAHLN